MRNPNVLQGMKTRIEQAAVLATDSSRRIAHGSSPWSLPRALNTLRQPQDGAHSETNPLLSTAQLQGSSPLEPEDARLTGGTRSLTRRLMGLNVTESPRKPAAATALSLSGRRQLA